MFSKFVTFVQWPLLRILQRFPPSAFKMTKTSLIFKSTTHWFVSLVSSILYNKPELLVLRTDHLFPFFPWPLFLQLAGCQGPRCPKGFSLSLFLRQTHYLFRFYSPSSGKTVFSLPFGIFLYWQTLAFYSRCSLTYSGVVPSWPNESTFSWKYFKLKVFNAPNWHHTEQSPFYNSAKHLM